MGCYSYSARAATIIAKRNILQYGGYNTIRNQVYCNTSDSNCVRNVFCYDIYCSLTLTNFKILTYYLKMEVAPLVP